MNKMMKQAYKRCKKIWLNCKRNSQRKKTVEATAGGGVVKAIASGRKQLVKSR